MQIAKIKICAFYSLVYIRQITIIKFKLTHILI